MGLGEKVGTDMFAVSADSQLAATRGAAKRAICMFETPGGVWQRPRAHREELDVALANDNLTVPMVGLGAIV